MVNNCVFMGMKLKELVERVRAGESVYLNADCMDYLPHFPENFFDCAVVDPPTGQGEDGKSNHSRGRGATKFTPKNWDKSAPFQDYFDQIFRICNNQIIWCAAYYQDKIKKPAPGWIYWKKNQSGDFGDGELAYCSFGKAIREFEFTWNGMLQGDMKNKETRIHPTQKPKALYHWIAKNYLKPGQLVLDSHVGSGNSLAVYDALGIQYVGFELDPDYYRDSQKNIATYKAHFKRRSEEEIKMAGGQKSIFDL